MKYSGFRRDAKRHVCTFSTSGQRQVTTCCTCAVTSRKKCHVSGCRRQAGDVCCLRCLLNSRGRLFMVLTLTPRASAISGHVNSYSANYSSWSLLISNLGRLADLVEHKTVGTGCQLCSASAKIDVTSPNECCTSSITFPLRRTTRNPWQMTSHLLQATQHVVGHIIAWILL